MKALGLKDFDVNLAKFARAATMGAFGVYRYWSARDADGFVDMEPKSVERMRGEAWAR